MGLFKKAIMKLLSWTADGDAPGVAIVHRQRKPLSRLLFAYCMQSKNNRANVVQPLSAAMDSVNQAKQ